MAELATAMFSVQMQLAALLSNVTLEFVALEGAVARLSSDSGALGSRMANISSTLTIVNGGVELMAHRIRELGGKLDSLETRLIRLESDESAREAREVVDDRQMGARVEVQLNMLQNEAKLRWWELASNGMRYGTGCTRLPYCMSYGTLKYFTQLITSTKSFLLQDGEPCVAKVLLPSWRAWLRPRRPEAMWWGPCCWRYSWTH